MKVLRKKIHCEKTLALIHSSLTAGHIRMGGTRARRLQGTPQGSVLSPLLCNIYMHELDLHMDRVRRHYTQGKRRKITPIYNKLMTQLKGAKT
jgi:RNA-directed DNA polymerase